MPRLSTTDSIVPATAHTYLDPVSHTPYLLHQQARGTTYTRPIIPAATHLARHT